MHHEQSLIIEKAGGHRSRRVVREGAGGRDGERGGIPMTACTRVNNDLTANANNDGME